MKMIFLIASFIFSTVLLASIGPVGSSTNLDGAGNVIGGTLEKRFINVYNRQTSPVTLTRGAVVVWDTSNDDGYSVTTSSTAGAAPACVLEVDCASGKLCKCQVYGYHDGLLFLTAAAQTATAGQKIYISEVTAGYMIGQAASSVDHEDKPVGIWYDTTQTSGAIEGFIRLD